MPYKAKVAHRYPRLVDGRGRGRVHLVGPEEGLVHRLLGELQTSGALPILVHKPFVMSGKNHRRPPRSHEHRMTVNSIAQGLAMLQQNGSGVDALLVEGLLFPKPGSSRPRAPHL
uniref:Uncharacterized protein n=1 Tax=Eutreptiella gymnastica TaxID=73025 RepID=A0A7S1IYE4_9EUGL